MSVKEAESKGWIGGAKKALSCKQRASLLDISIASLQADRNCLCAKTFERRSTPSFGLESFINFLQGSQEVTS